MTESSAITRAPRRHPTAGFRIFEGQATIVMPDGSFIHVLNEIGSRVWDLLNGQRTESDIVDIICEEFDTTREVAENDVREFLATLEANRMLG
jgi:coenzyme PQQ synthesis protein D (PqqD)